MIQSSTSFDFKKYYTTSIFTLFLEVQHTVCLYENTCIKSKCNKLRDLPKNQGYRKNTLRVLSAVTLGYGAQEKTLTTNIDNITGFQFRGPKHGLYLHNSTYVQLSRFVICVATAKTHTKKPKWCHIGTRIGSR